MKLVTLPQQLVVDVDGTPRSGAKLYVYAPGTTTPRTTYTTAALSTPHANPVESDSTGLFPAIYNDPDDGPYKLVLKDSADPPVTIWTEDNIPSGDLDEVPGASLQAFALEITNDGGTLKHRFVDSLGSNAASSFVDRITGATNTLTTTPTGADASTAFAGGGKVGSVQTHEFILNHANAAAAAHAVNMCSIGTNDSDTDLIVGFIRRSLNVNGVTLERWHLQFRQTSDGAAFALNTSNIASGETVGVKCLLYIA